MAVPAGVGAQAADCPSGFSSATPIVINTAADWNATNVPGLTGAGTTSDPYVIQCLGISGSSSSQQAGIYVAAASGVPFIIRDVQLTGLTKADTYGIEILGSAGDAAIEHVTISGYSSTGIEAGAYGGNLRLDLNSVTGGSNGLLVGGGRLVSNGNFVSDTAAFCESITAAGSVTGDSCIDNGGEGFAVGTAVAGSTLVLTANTAEGNAKVGFDVGGAEVISNVSEGNGIGIFNGSSSTVTDNVIDSNHAVGIELGASVESTISDNTIEHNGGAAIIGDPAYTGGPAFTWDNYIYGNKIGYNAGGIMFLGANVGNQVWGTTWTDGQQNISDPEGLNTIVDAGSNKTGSVGTPVLFNDYIDRVTVETGTTTLGSVFIPLFGALGTGSSIGPFNYLSAQPAANVAVNWNFGDGTSQCAFDATQGHEPPSFSHTYAAAGTYTATLTVSVVDQSNTSNPNPCVPSGPAQTTGSFTSTVPVTVAS
ncbi:MAG: right-handed parallel beta-helix repeat-containing protein [Acidimicrobiales bacterium]